MAMPPRMAVFFVNVEIDDEYKEGKKSAKCPVEREIIQKKFPNNSTNCESFII
jgi:hypothetical protein